MRARNQRFVIIFPTLIGDEFPNSLNVPEVAGFPEPIQVNELGPNSAFR
jgi:hypothetical protein